MRGWLLSLYPKGWRELYGDEYEALLDDTEMSPAVVMDILKGACLARLQAHASVLTTCCGIILYCTSGLICLRLGLTANWPFWAPSNPERALGLIVTLTPLSYVIYARLKSLDRLRRQGRTSTLALWVAAAPLDIILVMLSALLYNMLLLSTGLSEYILGNQYHYVIGGLALAGMWGARVILTAVIAFCGFWVIQGLAAVQARLLRAS
jgi:hypothetical protein